MSYVEELPVWNLVQSQSLLLLDKPKVEELPVETMPKPVLCGGIAIT